MDPDTFSKIFFSPTSKVTFSQDMDFPPAPPGTTSPWSFRPTPFSKSVISIAFVSPITLVPMDSFRACTRCDRVSKYKTFFYLLLFVFVVGWSSSSGFLPSSSSSSREQAARRLLQLLSRLLLLPKLTLIIGPNTNSNIYSYQNIVIYIIFLPEYK